MNRFPMPCFARQPSALASDGGKVPRSLATLTLALVLGLVDVPLALAQQATGGAGGVEAANGHHGGKGGNAGEPGTGGSGLSGGLGGNIDGPGGTGSDGGGGGGGGSSNAIDTDITTTVLGGNGGSGGPGGWGVGHRGGGGGGGAGGDGARISSATSIAVHGTVDGGVGGSGADSLSSDKSGGGGGGGAGLVRLEAGDLAIIGSAFDFSAVTGGRGGTGGTVHGGGGGGGAGIIFERTGILTIHAYVVVAGGSGGRGYGVGSGGSGGAGVQLKAGGAVHIDADSAINGGAGIGTGAGGAAISISAASGNVIHNAGQLQGGMGGGDAAFSSSGADGGNGSGGALGFAVNAPRHGRSGIGVVATGGGVTLVNAGSIAGGGELSFGQALAVLLSDNNNRVEVHSGASFTGNVEVTGGGVGNVLALSGPTDAVFDVSTLGDASQFRGFNALEKIGGSVWELTGTSDFADPTAVKQGTLGVLGSIANSAVTVESGAILGGIAASAADIGRVGDTKILDGGSLFGFQGKRLTMATLDVSSSATVVVQLGAPGNATPLFETDGNLALGGTLDLDAAGGFGLGRYRLFGYSGALSGALIIGAVPAGFQPSQMRLDTTSTPGQIHLVVEALPDGDTVFRNGFDPPPN